MAVYASNAAVRGPFASSTPPGIVQHAAPAGTFLPGTKVQVGTHRVVIDRYLSEGGFAHVYVVTLPRPVDGNEKAVLKRVAVPDKEHLANMRTEVETMKRLRGHNKIVKYIDSHASQLKGGGYEVFLLMEFCQGGGLIDFMNTRLQNRLTEPEILKIFTDIAEGVAAMHYLKPVLLHRDLKVENVLIATSGTKKTFKLCDFGSAAQPQPAATSAAEARVIEDDIQRHTTMQYRSPEMIDVYRKIPIDEKSDIWALGVFLYKLCYYTTPFEEVGQSAILNAKFKYPAYPRFSDQLKLLIATMLRERSADRPNIYQVLQKACQLDGRELPVRDIYAHRSQSEGRKDQVMPSSPSSAQSRVGATLSPPTEQSSKQEMPDIAPMRRGRPTKPVSHHGSAKPSPSPLRMLDHGQTQPDPFAALDGRKAGTADELSSKFPTLDEFSLMTDTRKNFAFDSGKKRESQNANSELAQRVTNALADQAFVRSPSPPKTAKPMIVEKPVVAAKPVGVLEKTRSKEQRESSTGFSQPAVPAKSTMVSTGTMTSSSPTIPAKPLTEKPIWKVPSNEIAAPRPTSTGQPLPKTRAADPGDKTQSRLARLLQQDASQSQGNILEQSPRSPTSSRPSLEGGRPDPKEVDLGLARSRSLDIRRRPVTVNMGAGPTHIKDNGIKSRDYETNFISAEPVEQEQSLESDMNITSDMEWLKAREEEERERKGHHKRLSSSGSKHGKRSSLPHMSLSGTKHILTGRFGDAFKKFEGGHGSPPREHHLFHHHHSPSIDAQQGLPPIPGSEATDLSDDRQPIDETEDLSPEMRRELEKRQLEAEEKRVAQAAAAYRQRVAARGGSNAPVVGVNRAATIQSKVQSLISENSKPAMKTATGYGRYTTETAPQSLPTPGQLPEQSFVNRGVAHTGGTLSAPASASNLAAQNVRGQRPMAPPKPQVLRNAQIVTDVPGASSGSGGDAMSPDDWEQNFHHKYPSLAGLEMVERDIETTKSPITKVREV
jgi:AP2-associated kinase